MSFAIMPIMHIGTMVIFFYNFFYLLSSLPILYVNHQISWTSLGEKAQRELSVDRLIMSKMTRIQSSILTELTSWCVEDLGQLDRVKVETLIAAQLHLRDVSLHLRGLCTKKNVTGSDCGDESKMDDDINISTFEWLKQVRVEWQPTACDQHGTYCLQLSRMCLYCTYVYK